MSLAPLVLIVEDSPPQVALAQALLRDLGTRIAVAETAQAAHEAIAREVPDIILLDLELPDGKGMDLMRRLKSEGMDSAIIVVTANGSVGVAVEAMREGARDFVVKPYNKARLTVTLNNALEARRLTQELQAVKADLNPDRYHGFIGASLPMRAVYRTIESVAASKATVFITGESGTGKELAAEAVHQASPRRKGAFIALNCGAIPKDLLESEIFGHTKGAFTGATENRIGAAKAADGGTLFLDEIGEMPMDMQVKLLRFVQTGSFTPVGATRSEKVDVRFVAATNRDIWAAVEEGRFREDLAYRLYVVPVEMPPLRERGADVIMIARAFLKSFAKEERKAFRCIAPDAEALLAAYPWPGNVRQLQNAIRNAVVLHEGTALERGMLPPQLLRAGPRALPAAAQPIAAAAPPVMAPAEQAVPPPPSPSWTAPPPEPTAAWTPPPEPAEEPPILTMKEIERRSILAALRHTHRDVPRAASLLEINPSTIYRRLITWREEGTLPPEFD
ncbi:MAG: sigma-54 dependent transcriptional regulator [Roseococcus sp.]|nr:sigma-54 dependent transcriptional regulator [Roseococcus sp.]